MFLMDNVAITKTGDIFMAINKVVIDLVTNEIIIGVQQYTVQGYQILFLRLASKIRSSSIFSILRWSSRWRNLNWQDI